MEDVVIDRVLESEYNTLLATDKVLFPFHLPDIRNILAIRKLIVNDKTLAYGLLHTIPELSIAVVDKDANKVSLTKGLLELLKEGRRLAVGNDISQLYTFSDRPFTDILLKLGFKRALGDVSYMDID